MNKLLEAQREREDDVALMMVILAMHQFCSGMKDKGAGSPAQLDLAMSGLWRAAKEKTQGDMIGGMALGLFQLCAAMR